MAISQVNNTTAHPYRTAVSIYVRWADGSTSRGSGTMVGQNDVITAAHVIYNPSRGAAQSIRVVPAQNGGNAPYGIIDGARWNYYVISYTASGNLTKSNSATDLAVIGLRQNPGTGWLGIKSNVTSTGTRNLIHYPSTYQIGFQNLRQMSSNGSVSYSSYYGTLNISNLQTSKGSSGSGIYIYQNNNRHVIGTVSTNSSGSFINTSRFNKITAWMSGNNSYMNSVTQHYNLGTMSYSHVGRSGGVDAYGNDRDRYAFYVASSATIDIKLYNQTGDAELRLFNIFGQQLQTSTNGGTSSERISRYLSSGIYYVEVDDYSGGYNSYALSAGIYSGAGKVAKGAASPRPKSSGSPREWKRGFVAAA